MRERTEELSFADGEAIIVEGERSQAVYFVADGVVKVVTRDEHDHEVVLARLQRGEIFGEMSLMGNAPSSATVVADGVVVVQRMTQDSFMEAIKSPLARMVMESLFARLRRMNSRFIEAESRLEEEGALTNRGDSEFTLTGVTKEMRLAMEGQSIVVDKFPFHIGRDDGAGGGIGALFSLWTNNLSIDDSEPYSVSRKHCLIEKRRAGFFLVDHHSHYGTRVDDSLVGGGTEVTELRLTPGRHRLQLGPLESPFVMQVDVPAE
ncbi:MAG: cyclic nucleotide-binding domain-containing protein [Mariprofundales bacterium]|nr:cyclic nucleotide-binding domain-containing protein [Mariprofundales bacterium]